MSFQNAVLGLVIERSDYGYELTQRINARVAGLNVGSSAVYPALGQLERKGWVRRRPSATMLPRGKVIFDATLAGRNGFHVWMDQPSRPLTGELRWKVLVASTEKLPALIEETRLEEQACLDQIELLTSDAREPIDPGADWAPLGRLVVQGTDVMGLQMQIQTMQVWRTEMKARLRAQARQRST